MRFFQRNNLRAQNYIIINIVKKNSTQWRWFVYIYFNQSHSYWSCKKLILSLHYLENLIFDEVKCQLNCKNVHSCQYLNSIMINMLIYLLLTWGETQFQFIFSNFVFLRNIDNFYFQRIYMFSFVFANKTAIGAAINRIKWI